MRTVRLGEIASMHYGKLPPKKVLDEGYQFLPDTESRVMPTNTCTNHPCLLWSLVCG